MKNNFVKNMSLAIVAGGLTLATSSCNKKEIAPSSPSADATSSSTQPVNAMALTLTSYNAVVGVNGAGNIYNIDPATGNTLVYEQMKYDGSLVVTGAAGVAKAVDPAFPNRYAVSAPNSFFCGVGSGTAFFFVEPTFANTSVGATAVRLGFLPGRTIKDIEYNPVDGFLYGIEGTNIVKILSLGSACSPGTAGAAPTVATIGNLATLSVTPGGTPFGPGPYSLAFNYAGQCNVISAKNHTRAIVDFSTFTIMSPTYFQGLATDMTDPQEAAMCISKQALIMGTIDKPTPTTLDYSYYHFMTSGVIGSWAEASNNCLADYTSKPESNIIIIHEK